MSKSQRHDNDAYYTHRGLVKALLDNVEIAGTVCEPCAGEGHIAEYVFNTGLSVYSADIDCTLEYPIGVMDATDSSAWFSDTFDWTVTNPPYRQPDCQKIIENAWEFSRVGIAMLLRLSYLEPCNGRASFLQNTPLSHLLVFNPRPQFRTDTKGTDSTTVAWFVWQKDWADNTQVKFITDWKNA